jgi:tetratricopeptide (TPR) repeat protein
VKRKRNKSSDSKVPNGARPSPGAASTVTGSRQTVSISRSRRWCYRLLALLIPLLVLGLLEAGLRVAGYGFHTAFFLNAKDESRAMLVDNPRFGWRFFPPAVARAPRPLYLAAIKAPGTVRIFVFGESAAMGDPEPAYGFARQLERLLQARHPDQKIEVINAAMTAINSHVIRQIARDCESRQGDFWLVYAGNNEVIGPFGAGTIFGQQAPSRTTARMIMALKTTRLGQLLTHVTRSAREPANWEGLEFFLRWQLPFNSPRLKRVYSSFAANLADIAELGRGSGATVLLSTMPVNFRDCPPLASLHRADLGPEKLDEWQKWFSAGTNAQATGRFAEAVSNFRKAGEIDDTFAELAFQQARCELELKQSAPADTDFRRARDLDTLRFRADSPINEIVRQTAKAKGISLLDADEAFAHYGGEDLFYDHVHLNFTGNYRVALLFAAEVEKHLSGTRINDSPWLTEAELAQRLAYTAFDEHRVGEEMRARMQQPPFNTQSNFRARDQRWRATLAALSAAPATCVSNYQAAVARAGEDWLLHANFARVLEAAGDNTNAATQWAEVSRLLPHSPEGWANQGRLARLAGDTTRAHNFLRTALKEQPESVATRTELAILEDSLGKTESARREFLSVLRAQPGFSPARVNLGLLLAHQGDIAGATAEFREELRSHPENVEARVNLANFFAAHGKTAEALPLYEEALALDPENPITRYNFGRVLMAENHPAEAVTNLEVALRQRPDRGETHYELAQALARVGREQEALGEFAQAVRLKPDLADAHLNYGVALARAKRYSEAVAEFRETLRLNPQDQRAQRMLEQAERSAKAENMKH